MVGVFDSGVGGLSVFREILRLLPGEKYIYYSDNAHCPYGEKSPEYVLERCKEISDFLIKKGADIIVVACNTATAAAIGQLREEYSVLNSARVRALTGGWKDHIMFIGMEPAVKPAVADTKTGVVGVLATAGTLNGAKYLNIKEKYEGDVKIIEHVGKGFVELVEKGILVGEEAEKTVRESLMPLIEGGADIIVLGCTHYPFLMRPIREIAGENIKIINPAPAVAMRLIDVMREEGLLSVSTGQSNIELFSSGDDTILKKLFSIAIQ